jgi:hypothetical protein
MSSREDEDAKEEAEAKKRSRRTSPGEILGSRRVSTELGSS